MEVYTVLGQVAQGIIEEAWTIGPVCFLEVSAIIWYFCSIWPRSKEKVWC